MPWDPDMPESEDYLPVESDLVGTPEPGDHPPRALLGGSGPTVIGIESDSELDQADDGMAPTLVADMSLGVEDEPASPALSGPKKRGRPSRSASGTPAASVKKAIRTPKSTKAAKVAPASASASASASSRKRKAPTPEPEDEEDEDTAKEDEDKPAPAKRGRPARATAAVASARLAAKAANKPTRGRPKGNGAATAAAKKPSGRGRKATSNGENPAGEYEVESIVDSQIDADTMEHMYLIKWKGYADSENTWEPKTNLSHALDLVKAFHAKKQKSSGTKELVGEKKKPGRKPKAKA